MKIKSHTISITEHELDTIGMGLEIYLEDCLKTMSKKTVLLVEEETIDLLQRLCACGYLMNMRPINDKNSFRLNETTDVHKWLDHKVREIAYENKKKKK